MVKRALINSNYTIDSYRGQRLKRHITRTRASNIHGINGEYRPREYSCRADLLRICVVCRLKSTGDKETRVAGGMWFYFEQWCRCWDYTLLWRWCHHCTDLFHVTRMTHADGWCWIFLKKQINSWQVNCCGFCSRGNPSSDVCMCVIDPHFSLYVLHVCDESTSGARN